MSFALTQLMGFNSVLRRPRVVSSGTADSTANLTTYTFSSHAISAAANGEPRDIYILVFFSGGTAGTVNAATWNGNDSTQLLLALATGGKLTVQHVREDAATTADIVVTLDNAAARCSIVTVAVANLSRPTQLIDSVTNTSITTGAAITLDLDVAGDGLAVGFVGFQGGVRTFTWSGLSEAVDQAVGENGNTYTMAYLLNTATELAKTVTATPSGAPGGTSAALSFSVR